ncbi:hypothetical protein BV20DRAFT_630566 [Pilatotrama ljubarskyi]|nr:hypothetical protein BV20DRAFT_630566 [Pilatotrama ljubarskyi]
MSPSTVIGHSHTKIVIPQTDARLPATNSSPSTPGHGHEVGIVAPGTEAWVPGHGHEVGIVIPRAEVSAGTDSTADTPTHGHGGRFVLPPPGDDPSTPVHPRPSARASRRGSLYTTADEANEHAAFSPSNATLEHALFDIARAGVMPPTMETEEPTSAELDGHFDQPASGREADAETEDASSRPLENA